MIVNVLDYEIRLINKRRINEEPKRRRINSSRVFKEISKNSKYSCIVKVGYKTISGKFPYSYIKNHIAYISRNHAGFNNEFPYLFCEAGQMSINDFRKFIPLEKEKNFFKIVLSPENHNINFEEFTKEVINFLDKQHDLDLVWQASIHQNTDNPHVHLLIRGIDKNKKEVRLKKDIIKEVLRKHSIKYLNNVYGEKTLFQTLKDLDRSIESKYITKIDRTIDYKIKKVGNYNFFYPENKYEYARLQFLEKEGVAKKFFDNSDNYVFKIDKNFLDTLKQNQHSIDFVKQKYNR